jgi:predicted ATPase
MNMLQPAHLGHLALIHASAGDQEAGLRLLDQAVRMAKETEERVFEAELYRLRGEILIQSQRTAEAETAFYSALAQARQRQAMMWELRAAMSMARLWRDQGTVQQARELLAPVYWWFTEGFDTLDLKEAKALLEELA